MQEGKRKEPLYVYLPEGPEHLVEEIKSWNDVFAVISLQEAQKAVNDFNLFQLRFFPVQHQIPAYGVQFSVGDQPLLTYTGVSYDTALSVPTHIPAEKPLLINIRCLGNTSPTQKTSRRNTVITISWAF